MVGQIELISWMLCVYLVYKGYEIFQAAFICTSEKRKIAMIFSTIVFAGSIFLAIGFFVLMEFFVTKTFSKNF
jgi:hypothetical protein